MARFAFSTTVVLTLLLLLDGLGSLVPEETAALSVMTPPVAGAVIEKVRMGSCPIGTGPGVVQVMVPPDTGPQVQFVPDPIAPVTPVGRVSTTVTVPLI